MFYALLSCCTKAMFSEGYFAFRVFILCFCNTSQDTSPVIVIKRIFSASHKTVMANSFFTEKCVFGFSDGKELLLIHYINCFVRWFHPLLQSYNTEISLYLENTVKSSFAELPKEFFKSIVLLENHWNIYSQLTHLCYY